ncbi:MAG: DedA family protein [Longimicrobiales bacterium]
MADLTDTLFALLPEYGPWLLFVMAVLETSFVTGLVVPSGLATAVGTALALEGQMALPEVLVAAAAGGWLGDISGFWIGQVWGERVLEGRGRVSRAVARRQPDLERFFGRHPVLSVTVARLVSFVRTLMPMTAGMSQLSFRRYLPYEALGLAGWLAIYVGIGAAGQESWTALTRVVGVGGTLAFAGVATAAWIALRRVRRSGPSARSGAGKDPAAPATDAGPPEAPC